MQLPTVITYTVVIPGETDIYLSVYQDFSLLGEDTLNDWRRWQRKNESSRALVRKLWSSTSQIELSRQSETVEENADTISRTDWLVCTVYVPIRLTVL